MKSMKNVIFKNIDILFAVIFSLFISVVIFRKILFNDGYVIYGDMAPSYDTDQFLGIVFSPDYINLLPELSLRLLFYIPSILFDLDVMLINKLMMMTILFLSSSFTILSTRKFINILGYQHNQRITLILTIVAFGFIFNHWTTFYILMHPWLVLSMSAIPLFTIILFYSKKNVYTYITLSFLFAVISTQIHSVFVLFILIATIFLFYIISGHKKCVRSIIIPLFIIFLMNSWFLFPWICSVSNGTIGPSTIYEYELPKDKFLNWWNRYVDPLNFLKFDQHWYKNIDYTLASGILDRLLNDIELLQGLVYFSSLLFFIIYIRRDKDLRNKNLDPFIYSVITIIIFFSILSSGVFKDLFAQYLDLSFMWIFRNLDKYTGIVLTILSMIFGFTLSRIKTTKIFYIIILSVVIIFSLINWPLFTGNFNDELNVYKLPEEYKILKNMTQDKNVFIAPSSSFALPYWINSTRYNAANNPLSNYLTGRLFKDELYTKYQGIYRLFGFDYIIVNLESKNKYWDGYTKKILKQLRKSNHYDLIWNDDNLTYFIFENRYNDTPFYITGYPKEILRYDFDSENFNNYFSTRPNNFTYNIEDHSLHLYTNSSRQYDWSWIESSPIHIKQYDIIKVSNMQRQDKSAIQTHMAIDIYQENIWKRFNNYCGGGNGVYDWTEFECVLIIPENTTQMKLIINAGWADDDISSTWFKNITVYSLGNIDDTIFINYDKYSPTSYHININLSKPSTLVFAENYNPSWIARIDKIDGKPVKSPKIYPKSLYSTINGFQIDHSGNLDIIIEYDPQYWFKVGLMMTIITCCILYIYYDIEWRK